MQYEDNKCARFVQYKILKKRFFLHIKLYFKFLNFFLNNKEKDFCIEKNKFQITQWLIFNSDLLLFFLKIFI